MDWRSAVEYDLATHWHDRAGGRGVVPNELYAAIKETLGKETGADLVHWIDSEDDIAFLMINGESVCLVRHAAPATTIAFLGSLVGGCYSETVSVGENGVEKIEAEFTHERLKSSLRVTLERDTTPGQPLRPARPGEVAALERTQTLRETLRRWANESPRSPNG